MTVDIYNSFTGNEKLIFELICVQAACLWILICFQTSGILCSKVPHQTIVFMLRSLTIKQRYSNLPTGDDSSVTRYVPSLMDKPFI